MRARRALTPLAGVVVALALYPATHHLDDLAREGQLGPGFWPRLALAGLTLACLAKAVEEARSAAQDRARPPLPPIDRGTLAAGVALIVGYALATPWLGFPLTTAGFIVGFMALCGARSPASIVGAAALGTVTLIWVFVKLVYLPLPKGDGPFETLTLALYRVLGVF